jgi:hypothetical protein
VASLAMSHGTHSGHDTKPQAKEAAVVDPNSQCDHLTTT